MSFKDGGAAFPRAAQFKEGEAENYTDEAGMTLRDYFAGQVIAASSHEYGNGTGGTFHDLAIDAYNIADEMIKQRNKLITNEN